MKTRTRTIILLTIAFPIVAAVALFFSFDFLVEPGSRRVMPYLAARGPAYGIEIEHLDFKSVETTFFREFTWKNCTASGSLKRNAFFRSDQTVTLSIDEVTLRPHLFGSESFHLTARGIIAVPDTALSTPGERDTPILKKISGDSLDIWFKINVLKPQKASWQAKHILGELKGLLEDGRCGVPVSFSGLATFPIGDKAFSTRISIVRENTESILVMNELDLIQVSDEFGLERPLTESEVRILSRNPLKVPRLFELRNHARTASREARRKDHGVPEDAYRHVLWSYLLTKSYGPDFAEQITDAHEQGRTGNSPEERLMDINNNTVGRNYALSGAPESVVLARIMADSDVIRSPGETGRKPILR